MRPLMLPIAWDKPDGLKIEEEGGARYFVALVHDGADPLPALPVEFFNREMMEFDPGNAESLTSFISSYGFPLDPLRYAIAHPSYWDLTDASQELASERERCIRETELSPFWLEERRDYLRSDGEMRLVLSGVQLSESVREAENALRALQDMARACVKYARSEDGADLDDDDVLLLDLVGRSTVPPLEPVFMGERAISPVLTDRLKLTHAVCNQMQAFLELDVRARLCENEKCRRVFKQKRGDARYRVNSVARYCCTKCETAQRQRDYRRRKKSEKAT